MSQNFTSNTYESGHNVVTDMQNIENSLNALWSTMSGEYAPPNANAGTQWLDTTNDLWQIRNSGDDAWLAVPAVSSGQKLWVYSNVAMEGWVIDPTITDVVISVNGGSNAYNVEGGTLAGTWTQPGHALTASECSQAASGGYVADGVGAYYLRVTGRTNNIALAAPYVNAFLLDGVSGQNDRGKMADPSYPDNPYVSGYQHLQTSYSPGSTGVAHNHGATYRPAAAVGTLQEPKLMYYPC